MAHILLAEDDRAMRQFIQKALENAGHIVDAEGDGLAALSHLEGDAAYDLLLTDIVMPGIDGIELSQKATALYPAMKVMFITGFAAVAMDAKDQQTQSTKVLSKPFHLNDLVAQVETILQAA